MMIEPPVDPLNIHQVFETFFRKNDSVLEALPLGGITEFYDYFIDHVDHFDQSSTTTPETIGSFSWERDQVCDLFDLIPTQHIESLIQSPLTKISFYLEIFRQGIESLKQQTVQITISQNIYETYLTETPDVEDLSLRDHILKISVLDKTYQEKQHTDIASYWLDKLHDACCHLIHHVSQDPLKDVLVAGRVNLDQAEIKCYTQEELKILYLQKTKVKDTSKLQQEADGTIREYWLRIHPECRPMRIDAEEDMILGEPQEMTPLNARASTFGLTGKVFQHLADAA